MIEQQSVMDDQLSVIGLDPFAFWLIAFANEMSQSGQVLQLLDYSYAPEYFSAGWTPDEYAHAALSWRI